VIKINLELARPDAALIERAAAFSAATLHETLGKKGALPYEIKPVAPDMRVCGAAITVRSPAMNNLTLHQAILVAQPGDVLVVSVNGAYEAGYWGEIMTTAAKQRGLAGLVIDGCVRDGALLPAMGFSVFARGLSIRGTGKDDEGEINYPVTIGDVKVAPGDLVVGDTDGVVVVPRAQIAATIDGAREREQREARILQELAAGKTTLELYGWRLKPDVPGGAMKKS